MTWLNATTPGWFATMGIPIRAGRDFDGRDRTGAPATLVVNDAFVRRFYRPGDHPVGTVVRIGGPSRTSEYRIIGVVADAVYRRPREGMMPTAYVPVAQQAEIWSEMALTLRLAPGTTAQTIADVAAALVRVDPAVVITFRDFDQLLDATVTQERLVAVLSTFFGGLGLLLAAVGLYGIVSHAVRARRTEFGVRMALGASPTGILLLVLRRVCVLLVVGLVLGLAGSYWASGFVRTLLYQLEPRDPMTFVTAALVLTVIAIAAAALPAWRAARLDPASVLRES
jgi:ABC-type antimicrobial peptide transport system permease subunit